jgi:hypothetical protein
MSYSQTVQGARACLKITTPDGEKTVAWATGVSYNENCEHIPIYVLDNLAAKEYAPVGYSASMSVQAFRIPGMSPKSQGFQQKLQNILTEPELKIVVYDRNLDTPLLVAERVKFIGRSGGVSARGEWTESWEFAVIQMYDESGK